MIKLIDINMFLIENKINIEDLFILNLYDEKSYIV